MAFLKKVTLACCFVATIFAQDDPVHYESLTWSPNGERFTVTTAQGVKTFQVKRTEDVLAAFSPDGRSIIIVHETSGNYPRDHLKDIIGYQAKYTLCVYTMDTQQQYKRIQEQFILHEFNREKPYHMFFASAGRGIYLQYDDYILAFDLSINTGFLSPKKIHKIPFSAKNGLLTISPPGTFASAILRYENLESLGLFETTKSSFLNLQFSETLSLVKNISIYNCLRAILDTRSNRPQAIAYSADGRLLAFAATVRNDTSQKNSGSEGMPAIGANQGSAAGEIYIYEIITDTLEHSEGSPIVINLTPSAIAFNPKDTTLAVIAHDKDQAILTTYQYNKKWKKISERKLARHIDAVTFSPDGNYIALTAKKEGTITILRHLDPPLAWPVDEIKALEISSPLTYAPDGNLALAIIDKKTTIFSVNKKTGELTFLSYVTDPEVSQDVLPFTPETDVLSIPNETGGFSIVSAEPEKMYQKIVDEETKATDNPQQRTKNIYRKLAALRASNSSVDAYFKTKEQRNQRKIEAIQTITGKWEKELAETISFEEKIKILTHWNKMLQKNSALFRDPSFRNGYEQNATALMSHFNATITEFIDNYDTHSALDEQFKTLSSEFIDRYSNLGKSGFFFSPFFQTLKEIIYAIERKQEINKDIPLEDKIKILNQWSAVVELAPQIFKNVLEGVKKEFELETFHDELTTNEEQEIEKEIEKLETVTQEKHRTTGGSAGLPAIK